MLTKEQILEVVYAMLGSGYYQASRYTDDETKIEKILILAFEEIFKENDFTKTLSDMNKHKGVSA